MRFEGREKKRSSGLFCVEQNQKWASSVFGCHCLLERWKGKALSEASPGYFIVSTGMPKTLATITRELSNCSMQWMKHAARGECAQGSNLETTGKPSHKCTSMMVDGSQSFTLN